MVEELLSFDSLTTYDVKGAQERYEENKNPVGIEVVPKEVIPDKHSPGRRLGKPNKGFVRPLLKKLSPRHYEMIALHLRGVGHKEVAETLNVTYTNVYVTLKDPLSRQIIEEFYEAHKVDLMGLFPNAIDAVRKGLNDEDAKVKLLAVDKFIKLKESTEETSKDITQVTITVVNTAREKLIGAIKNKIPTLVESEDGSFSPEGEV